MQTSPLTKHLIDLNKSEAEGSGAGVLSPFGATHSASRIAAADASGYDRGLRMADTEIKRVLAEQEARLRREFDAARVKLMENEAGALAKKIDDGISALRMELSGAIAQAISPFVVGRLRDQALEDIVSAAEDLVKDAMPLTIEVSGPADFTPVLVQRLQSMATVVRVAAVSSPEIRIRVDKHLIETRLTDWVGHIEGALV